MTDTDLLLSKMGFASVVVASVTFGGYVILAMICIHYLVKQGKGRRLRNHVFLIYTIVMLFTATIWFVVGTYWSSLEFIGSTSINPALLEGGNARLAKLKDFLFVFNVWLADSMIIYRLYIIWGSSISVVAFPCLLWLATVGFGLAIVIITAQPAETIYGNVITILKTTFFCLSISCNIICTVLIAGMLWYHQWQFRQIGSMYSGNPILDGAIAIVIESAALYSVVGIIVIPTIVKQLPLASVVATLIGTVTCIAPTLIILRLALGVAENPIPTKTKPTTVAFVTSSANTDIQTDSGTVDGSRLGARSEQGNFSKLSLSADGGAGPEETV